MEEKNQCRQLSLLLFHSSSVWFPQLAFMHFNHLIYIYNKTENWTKTNQIIRFGSLFVRFSFTQKGGNSNWIQLIFTPSMKHKHEKCQNKHENGKTSKIWNGSNSYEFPVLMGQKESSLMIPDCFNDPQNVLAILRVALVQSPSTIMSQDIQLTC